MRLENGSPFKIQLRESLSYMVEFHGDQSGRAIQPLTNVVQEPMYISLRPVTTDVKNMNFLLYCQLIYHLVFGNLLVVITLNLYKLFER